MNCDCGSEVTTAVVEVPAEKTRLTDWLKEHLSYDDIVDSEAFAEDLLEGTGMSADWRTRSYRQKVKELKEHGKAGCWLSKECKGKRLADAIEIVEALGYKYVPGFKSCRCYYGRGKMYYADFAQLVAAGL